MPTEEKETNKFQPNNLSKRLYQAGTAFVAVSVLIILLTYYPVIKEELRFELSRSGKVPVVATREEKIPQLSSREEVIYPEDEDFGIVIPKISANSKVIADVSWQNSEEYQKALTQGVAHAKGTAKPGEEGNVFIFAHSGVDFYEAARYNAVFYLLSKMEKGDEIYAFYQKNKIVYRVTESKLVTEDQVEYLDGDPKKKTITLMTCWPAGTTWKRLIVIAEQE